MSRPVIDSAFVAVWLGNGLPNACQLRTAHGANTITATTATTPIRRTRSAIGRSPVNQTRPAQTTPSQIASLRVSAARPMTRPSASSRGLTIPGRSVERRIRVISRHAISASAVNTIVESGSDEWSSSGR